MYLSATKEQGFCPYGDNENWSENGDITMLHCFLTTSNLSHRLGPWHANQCIENPWSHFKGSFSAWVIDCFKQLVHDGIFVPVNFVHMECIWFVYADFLERKLD